VLRFSLYGLQNFTRKKNSSRIIQKKKMMDDNGEGGEGMELARGWRREREEKERRERGEAGL
jgi:hypothetical protein